MKNAEKNRRAWQFLHSSFFILPSLTVAAAEDETPKLAPPLPELPPTFWEQHGTTLLLASLAALLLVALLVWRLLRPRPAVVIPPEVLARQALEALGSRAEDGAVLSEVSQILHRYFRTAFALPPDELTTAEFCRTLAAHETIGPELAAAVAEFLRQCDDRKFSLTGAPASSLAFDVRTPIAAEDGGAPIRAEQAQLKLDQRPSPQPSPRLGGERESAAVARALELIAQAEARRAELRAAATPLLTRA